MPCNNGDSIQKLCIMPLNFKSLLSLILVLMILLIACGKKGEPTLKGYQKPKGVTGLKVLHRGSEIYIYWEISHADIPYVKECYLLKSEGTDKDFREIAKVSPRETLFIDRDFLLNKKYYYKMRCANLKGIFSDDSSITEILTLPPPPIITDLSYSITNDSVDIKWNKIEGALYNVYKSYQKGNYSIEPINKEPLKESLYIDHIPKDRTVFYVIRSLQGTEVRNESDPSDEIVIDPYEFIPLKPVGLSLIPLENGKVYLLWKENPEIWVKAYRVYRKFLEEKEFSFVGETNIPVFIDEIPLDTIISYYVTSKGPKRESEPSQTIQIELKSKEQDKGNLK